MKKETKATGQVIRDLRKIKGLTQMELAELMGVSYQQIQKYEKNLDAISVQRLKQLSRALDVPTTLFFQPDRESVSESQEPYGKLREDERLLVQMYRNLKNKKTKQAVLEFLKTLSSTERRQE